MIKEHLFGRLIKDLSEICAVEYHSSYYAASATAREFFIKGKDLLENYGELFGEYFFNKPICSVGSAVIRASCSPFNFLLYSTKERERGIDMPLSVITSDEEFAKQNNQVKWFRFDDFNKAFQEFFYFS